MADDIMKILAASGALIKSDHFVYKAGTHGSAYINKERFTFLGARDLVSLIRQVADNAMEKGLRIIPFTEKKIGVLGPAMGAISYSLTLAEALEKGMKDKIFFTARTELVADGTGKKVHRIPEKLAGDICNSSFIIFEDIVNNGTTIREVKELLRTIGGRVFAAMCFVDRGGQTAESLGVGQYYPLLRVDMTQYEAQECPLCQEGKPINTILGKGDRWIKLFGQPPYPKGKDFSVFWA